MKPLFLNFKAALDEDPVRDISTNKTPDHRLKTQRKTGIDPGWLNEGGIDLDNYNFDHRSFWILCNPDDRKYGIMDGIDELDLDI